MVSEVELTLAVAVGLFEVQEEEDEGFQLDEEEGAFHVLEGDGGGVHLEEDEEGVHCEDEEEGVQRLTDTGVHELDEGAGFLVEEGGGFEELLELGAPPSSTHHVMDSTPTD